jgi:hypothetical protein
MMASWNHVPTYRKVKRTLDELQVDHDTMQYMWDYCLKNGHEVIISLASTDISWCDLEEYAIRNVVDQYKKMDPDTLKKQELSCPCCGETIRVCEYRDRSKGYYLQIPSKRKKKASSDN